MAPQIQHASKIMQSLPLRFLLLNFLDQSHQMHHCILVQNWERNTSRLYIVTLLI